MKANFNDLTVIVNSNSDDKNEDVDCLVDITDNKSSIVAFNKKYSFYNNHENEIFNLLFKKMLYVLDDANVEKTDKTLSIKCLINNQKGPNAYQIVRAILCAFWGFSQYNPKRVLEQVSLFVEEKYAPTVQELFKTKTYRNFTGMNTLGMTGELKSHYATYFIK